ncbi:MAG: primosomal protein N' [Nitrospinae bacterium]|nr:primosomal protein N' [Nitrospinota bacterium]
MKKTFVEVIVPRPVRPLFTYSVPDGLAGGVAPGKRVEVPFGKRSLIGLIAKVTNKAEVETKPVISVIDPAPVVAEDLLKLAVWTARHYYAPPGDVIQLIMPKGDVKLDTVVLLVEGAEASSSRSKSAALMFSALSAKGGSRKLELLAADMEVTPAEMKKIVSAGVAAGFVRVTQSTRQVKERKAAGPLAMREVNPVELNAAQVKAFELVAEGMDASKFSVTLIHGVTGSGKTEVYATLARKALDSGKSVIALAPEIALADLLADRFHNRLGFAPFIIHSDMPPGERDKKWRAIAQAGPALVVGARSAVFAPVENLGLVIVDEEHDNSYKQETSPRYNGRDVAIMRGSICGAAVALGSATPSLESYHHALSGKYALAELPHRIDARPMPKVEIVEPEPGGGVGERLKSELAVRLERGEQSLLFINRRGAARYVMCGVCGKVVECRNCSISLVYHISTKTMRCHTCGYEEPAPKTCAQCDSADFFLGGLGSERIEKDIEAMFPAARVARMDRDTTSGRHAGSKILRSVGGGEVDILIGTQMVTKGHDYPNITLVGAVSADDTLHIPDFRAGERTFQLVTQAAGRAGRGDAPGLVIVQSKSADHHSVACAAGHDYKAFYETEINLRQATGYPPFARLAFIRIDASTQEVGEKYINMIRSSLEGVRRKTRGLEILGPAEGVIFRTKNRFNWRILLKAPNHAAIHAALDRFFDETGGGKQGQPGTVRVSVDMDPVNVM